MLFRIAIIYLVSSSVCHAQHSWQKPKPLVPRAAIEKIISPIENISPSEDRHIVWVWGYDKPHAPGAHDYLRVRDLMTGLLKKVPNITVETAYLFPTQSQFDKADLVIMFLHLPQLTTNQYAMFKSFIRRGGGAVAIHETAIIRPAAEGTKLAECLGMAWNEGVSRWGAIFEDISIDNQHPVFKGFGDKLKIIDEFYWDLNKVDGVQVIGSVRTGPPNSSASRVPSSMLSTKPSPMFWTLESGKGRVFGTTLGHNTFSYYDPELRIVLFRAMAWAMREAPGPLMPLVFDGITSAEGMVGTTDDMRNWKGKLRAPPEK
ncbi:MAG: ThuA domain-containing protein [Planctomycetaceae bacterium]|jgi:type 1 glutamine amidotransferase|nr:ThuA domain-containing protein [Planctomycetaceae bacterium]